LKTLSIFFFLLLLSCPLQAQIYPVEGSTLNYRLIGFSFPAIKNAGNYEIEIAEGNCNTTESFERNRIAEISCPDRKIVAEVPAFGRQYSWRINYQLTGAGAKSGKIFHFSTGAIPETDTNNVRLRIIRSAVKYKDAYVFVDGNKVLYDMSGRPVWYLPALKDNQVTNEAPRDLKLTEQHTFTVLLGEKACEINYNGDILWKAPDNGLVSGDSTEHYHHEFTRLSNGHYMVLGDETPLSRRKLEQQNSAANAAGQDTFFNNLTFGTVIEYDEKGHVVWSWKSSKYFLGSDIRYFNMPSTMQVLDVHENAFYFDEKNKYLYVSFRHLSRLLKVKYPGGEVVRVYGETFKPGVPQTGNGIFCGQHSCRRSPGGYLYLFNNGCDPAQAPKITLMQEPADDKGSLKVMWEYETNLEGMAENHHRVTWLPIWGNVFELPDSSMFVCTGSDHSKIFIVNRNKEELWTAAPEKWIPASHVWERISQYRASIIADRKDLETLIWNSEENGKTNHTESF
jgi:hypothetical protein